MNASQVTSSGKGFLFRTSKQEKTVKTDQDLCQLFDFFAYHPNTPLLYFYIHSSREKKELYLPTGFLFLMQSTQQKGVLKDMSNNFKSPPSRKASTKVDLVR